MTIEITTLGLALDTAPVKQGTSDLDKLGTSANKAADSLDAAGKRGAAGLNQISQSARDVNAAFDVLKVQEIARETSNAINGLTGNVSANTNAVLRLTAQIDTLQASIAEMAITARGGTAAIQAMTAQEAASGAISVEAATAKVAAIQRVTSVQNAQMAGAARLVESTTAGAASSVAAARATASQADAVQKLLGQIDPAQKKLAALDLLEQQLNKSYAAGAVEADVYAAALAKLNASRAAAALEDEAKGAQSLSDALGHLNLNSSMARLELGRIINDSVNGQYGRLTQSSMTLANATGIMGLAFSATGALILGGVAILGSVAAAYVKATAEEENFNKALIGTGNYTGQTLGSLRMMASGISEQSGTVGQAKDAVLAVAATGQFTADQLRSVAQAAVDMEKLTGQSIDKTIGEFEKIRQDPVRALQALDEQYHFLTPSTFAYIAALQAQGDTVRAATIGINQFHDVIRGREKESEDNLSLLGKAWMGLKKIISDVGDAAKSAFQKDTVEQQIAAVEKGLTTLTSIRNPTPFDLSEQARLQERLNLLRQQAAAQQAVTDATAHTAQVNTVLNGVTARNATDLQKQQEVIATYGKGTVAVVEYEKALDLARVAQVSNAADLQKNTQAVIDSYAPRLKAAEAVDKLTEAHKAATVSTVAFTRAQGDAAVAAVDQQKKIDEAAAKFDFSQGLETYTSYFDSLVGIENAAYAKTSAARATELASLQAELARLQSLAKGGTDSATQAAQTAITELQAKINKESVEHSAALTTITRDQATAYNALYDALNPTAKVLEDYDQKLLRANEAEALGLISKEQLAAYEARLAVARNASVKAIEDGLAPGDAAIKQLTEENAAIAQGITLQQYQTAEKLKAQGATAAEIAQVQQLTKEQKLLQELFSDNSDPTAAVQAGLQNIKNTVIDVGSAWGRLTDTAVTGLQNVVHAQQLLGEASKLSGQQQVEAMSKVMQVGLQGFAQLTAGAAGFFDNGSKGYKALHDASAVFYAADLALEVASTLKKLGLIGSVTTAKVAGEQAAAAASLASVPIVTAAEDAKATAAGTNAVAQAAASGPFIGFGAAVAMAALLASFGVLLKGGGGSGPAPSTNSGTGTVLGDSTAQSKSIGNSLDELVNLADKGLDVSTAQLQALRAIQTGINGVGTLLFRANATTTGGITPFNPQSSSGLNVSGTLGSLAINPLAPLAELVKNIPVLGNIASLFGNVGNAISGALFGSKKVTDYAQGIEFGSGTVGDAVSGATVASYFDTLRVHKSGGLLGNSSTSYRTSNVALDVSTGKQIQDIIGGLSGSIVTAVGQLGSNVTAAQDTLDKIPLAIGKVDLKGLTPQQVQDKLQAVFGALGDKLATAVLPQIGEFQQAGEGLYETLIRVSSETVAVTKVLADIGIDINSSFGKLGAGLAQAHVADNLISLAGGIDAFSSNLTTYQDKFLTDSQKFAAVQSDLTGKFAALNLKLPSTRAGFADIVRGLDLTTAAGQQTFTALTALSGTADTFYQGVEKQAADAATAAANALAALNAVNDKLLAFSTTAAAAAAAIKGTTDVYNMAQAIRGVLNAANPSARADAGSTLVGVINQQYSTQAAAIKANAQTQITAINATLQADLNRLNKLQTANQQAQQANLANVQAVQQAYQNLQTVARSLSDYSKSLGLSNLAPGSPIVQLNNNLAAFRSLVASAKAGDVTAAGQVQAQGDATLQLARSVYGSAQAFQDIFNEVQGTAGDLGKKLGSVTPDVKQLQIIAAQTSDTNDLLQRQIDQANADAAAQIAAVNAQSDGALADLQKTTLAALDTVSQAVLSGNVTQSLLLDALTAGNAATHDLLAQQLAALSSLVAGGSLPSPSSTLPGATAAAQPDPVAKLQHFATGGISMAPAIFGEAGPEAAVPLPNGRSIPVSFTGGSTESTRALLAEVKALRADLAKSDNTIALKVVTADGKVVREETIRDIKERSRRGETVIYAKGIA